MLANLLMLVLLIPTIGVCGILCLDNRNEDTIKNVALWTSVFALVLSFVSCFLLDKPVVVNSLLLSLTVSKMSLYFMTLTAFVAFVAILIGRYECNFFAKIVNLSIISMEAVLFFMFSNEDIVIFYILFEMEIIISFILLRCFASALAEKFFIFQSIGVLIMFSGIVYLINITGAMEISTISQYTLTNEQELVVFWTLIPMFMVQAAIFPFNFQMVRALSNLPTSISVVISGIFMKLSMFGTIFVLLPIVPHVCASYQMLFVAICFASIFCGIAEMLFAQNLRQIVACIDIIVAAIIFLGMFSLNTAGVSGTLFCACAYVTTSVSLGCFCYLIEKYGDNCSVKIKGLWHRMPTIAFLAEIPILSIAAIPLLPCFFGELALLTAYFDEHVILCCILAACFLAFNFISFAMFQKTIFGEGAESIYISKYDISMMIVLCVSILFVGIKSSAIQKFTTSAIDNSRIKELYKNVDL